MRTKMRTKRKGIVYALEGIFAALIIIGFMSQIGLTPPQQVSWGEANARQQAREFLSMMDGANLTQLVLEKKSAELRDVAGFFLGEANSYSLTTDGLFKDTIYVSVWVPEADQPRVTAGANTSCPLPIISEFGCKPGTTQFQSRDFFLADSLVDNRTQFDAVWIDIDGNGAYSSPTEGPFFKNAVFDIGGNKWSVGAIAENGSDITFLRATDIVRITEGLQRPGDLIANGRQTRFGVFGVTNKSGLTGLRGSDILVIPSNINLSKDVELLRSFVSLKKGIIEIADITSADQIDEVQKEIFGLQWMPFAISGTGAREPSFNPRLSAEKPSWILRYFFEGLQLRIQTKNTSAGFTVNCITNGAAAKIGSVNLKRQNYYVLVNSTGGVYSTAYISNDPNFCNGDAPLSAGSSTTIGGNSYILRAIDPTGNWIEIKAIAPKFSELLLPTTIKLYADRNETDRVILDVQNYNYQYADGLGFRVPAMIAYAPPQLGRAVWMPSQISADDEWALFRAAVLWAADMREEILRERAFTGSVASASTVLIAARDFFLPFSVNIKVEFGR